MHRRRLCWRSLNKYQTGYLLYFLHYFLYFLKRLSNYLDKISGLYKSRNMRATKKLIFPYYTIFKDSFCFMVIKKGSILFYYSWILGLNLYLVGHTNAKKKQIHVIF